MNYHAKFKYLINLFCLCLGKQIFIRSWICLEIVFVVIGPMVVVHWRQQIVIVNSGGSL